MVAGNPVTYERGKKHRVSVMMGGHAGATATASFDFVPDGTTVTATRDIVRTEACKQCHGADFHGTAATASASTTASPATRPARTTRRAARPSTSRS